MALNTSDMGLIAFQKFLDVVRSGKMKSLAGYTRAFRAEPFVLLDSECVFIDETFDVMQSLQSQYAALYLMAMSAMTTIGNASVARHMDKLNPSRNAIDSAANTAASVGGLMMAVEAEKFGIPKSGDVNVLTSGSTRDSAKEIAELSNLSVGKIIDCEIQDGDTKLTVPISIRLIASSLPSATLVHTLTGGTADTGFIERWNGWRSGRLSISDMLFCKDLINAKRKAMMSDDNGVYRSIVQRKNGNMLSTLLSGNPSVGTYSNMVVLADTTARELEIAMGNGGLKDFKAREKLMDNTALLLIAVIDRSWKRVTFYTQSIARPLECSFRDLKASNKGSGPDIADILNAYKLGETPTL